MAKQYPYVKGSNCSFPMIESTWPQPCTACCTATIGSKQDPDLLICQTIFIAITVLISLFTGLGQYQMYSVGFKGVYLTRGYW